MGNKISACLVVYNEEKCVERCLDSIKNVVDEIIIVHDGKCGDGTLEICKKYTNNIYVRKHFGVAEPHRPFSFERATGDWILQIDADEFLSDELKNKIPELAKADKARAYEFFWPLWNGNKYITRRWPHKLCFYKKEYFSYIGIPNFVAEVKGDILRSDLKLEHRPDYYNYEWKVFKNKWLKWAKLQAAFYLEKFEDIGKYNYKSKKWPTKIRLRVKFPLLFMPIEFLITFFKNLLKGAYKEGIVSYKLAFMISCYRVMVNYYIYKNK